MAIRIYGTNRNVGRFLYSAKGRHGGPRLNDDKKEKTGREEEEEEAETRDSEEGRQREKGKLRIVSADTDVGIREHVLCVKMRDTHARTRSYTYTRE